ncbi:hypothetical protein SAMN04488118_105184 [Epibacterium ulvae]|uniref:Uncharacterized protein n=1 Tax=Epibacterium ulvae TaxID=1156985 RepID=A0A1G5QSK2_9RHOB|nr:DUF6653 family protein [Epibacterium ulvae]SCZ64079.1 hypothetical protein SAMN04488118_105184 [Epibacterium ulvae]
MTLERRIARVFNLTDDNWMKHANPWSVWTRYSVLPLIVFAFWSRLWIGWWCLIPAGAALLWVFLNPIVFNRPKSTKNWASKAVLGERVYLNRDIVEIPVIHDTPLYKILNTISFTGVMIATWAIIYYSIWGAVLGVALAYLGKSWYLDRMVWLYEMMKSRDAEYQKWDY